MNGNRKCHHNIRTELAGRHIIDHKTKQEKMT